MSGLGPPADSSMYTTSCGGSLAERRAAPSLAEETAALLSDELKREAAEREAQKAALQDGGDAMPADETPTPAVKTTDSLPSLILRSKPVVEVVSSVPGGE